VVQLDGRGDYVRLPSGIFSHLEEATVEAWVKWEELGYYSQFFAFGSGKNWQAMGVNHWETTPVLQFFIYDRQRQVHVAAPVRVWDPRRQVLLIRDVKGTEDLLLNRWCHLAAVSGPGGMKLYLNGVLVAQDEYEGSFAAMGNGDENYLGRSHWPENADFQGQLDEVRVWAAARTGEQIRATLHQRLSGEEEGLVGLWNFDAGDARDASPRGHHGQLLGEARCVQARLPVAEDLVPPVVVRGVVRDATGWPLAGAEVRLEQGGRSLARTQTDAEGGYSLMVPPGERECDLGAVHQALGTWKLGLRLTPGESRRLDLRLREAVSITGRLLTLDRKVAHVKVLVEAVPVGSGEVARELTDAGGSYRFVNLKPGTYRVRCQVPEGKVYFGSSRGGTELQVAPGKRRDRVDFFLAPFKKGTWKSYTYLEGLPGNQVQALHLGDDGLLWVGTEGGLSRFDGARFTHFPAVDRLPNGRVTALHRDADGNLWIGTEEGVLRLAGTRLTHFTRAEGLADDRVRALHQSEDGLLWIGTHQGLSRYDGESFVNFTTADGLENDRVLALFRDADGVLWAGTEGGLSRYDEECFVNFTTADGLGDDRVWAIHRAPDGVLWLGSLGVSRYDGMEFVNFTREDGLVGNQVSGIAGAPNGVLWLATADFGVSRYEGGNFANFTEVEGLIDNRVNAVHRDRDGVLWFGTESGLSRYDGEGLASFTAPDGLADNRVRVIRQDRDGVLWVGTGDGLSRYDGSEFVNFTRQDGLAGNSVTALHPDEDGVLWVGTESGLSRYDGKSLVNCLVEERGVDRHIQTIFRDTQGLLWLGTRSGGVAAHDGAAWTVLDSRDGLAGNWVWAIDQAEDGSLLFGTDRGLTRYRRDRRRPRVRIVAVQTDRGYENLDTPEPVTVGHRVTVEFQALDFKTLPEKQQYRYRVRELDPDWGPPTKSSHFEWVPEEPGTYSFEVQAIDRDLNYSAPARLTLRVAPSWYRDARISLPAGAGVVALLLLAGVAVRNYSTQRGQARQLEEERSRLDLQLQELRYLYRLRTALSGARSAEEAVRLTGELLLEVLAGTLGGVRIEHDERKWERGICGEEEQTQYERPLAWGGKERGGLFMCCRVQLSDAQERLLMDETAGQLAGVLEAKELEMQLLQSSRLVSLGEMAAGVAHELNQPLGALAATAEDYYLRLSEGMEVSGEQWQKILKRLLGLTNRMADTVESLRLFSRDSSQEPGMRLALNPVIHSSLGLIGTQLRNRDIALRLELDPDLPPLVGNPHQLEQVFLNLVL